MAASPRSPRSGQRTASSSPPAGGAKAPDSGDRAAKLEASANNERARAKAKDELARRNEQAHKRARTKLAARDALRRDLRKGLEF